MNLLTVYEKMLNQAGYVVDSDGLVYTMLGGDKRPAIIEVEQEDGSVVGKRLIIPTNDQLKATTGWDSRIAFHPLKENVVSGESKIIESLRMATNVRINMIIKTLIEQSLEYGLSFTNNNGKAMKQVNAKKMALLDTVKDADQTTLEHFKKLMKKVSVTNTRSGFSSIYLKKLGKIGHETYSCVGKINFPFYRDLIESDKEFHGIKLRKKDFETFKRMLEYIIPGIEDVDSYQIGVSDSLAPFAESLVRITDMIGQALNKVTDVLFKNNSFLPKSEAEALWQYMQFTNDHLEVFDNLDSLLPEIRLIPQLPGNDGPIPKTLIPGSEAQLTSPTQTESVKDTPPWVDPNVSNTQDKWGKIEPVVSPMTSPMPQVSTPVNTPVAKTANGEIDLHALPWMQGNVINPMAYPNGVMYPGMVGTPGMMPGVMPMNTVPMTPVNHRVGALSANQMQYQQAMMQGYNPMYPQVQPNGIVVNQYYPQARPPVL